LRGGLRVRSATVSAEGVPGPVRKIDAAELLREINLSTGADLEYVEAAPGGAVGAAFVRWPDGRAGVLTRGFGSAADLRRTAGILDIARQHGLPVPEYQLVTELPSGTAVVQGRLPGRPPADVDRPLLESMIALTDRFAGLLVDRPDVPTASMYLLESGPGFCLHESLRAYDARTRRLLDWIHEVGRSDPSDMTGDDLVHLDFHTGNVLTEGGAITGIVDWDGIARGDRLFALVTLRFASHSRLPEESSDWFDELLETTLSPAVLRLYWAHMSLRLVDWSIRHHAPADTARWLDLAESRMH
jgi:aminoglycoside phosphotransferase (APT) family kinase protein